MNYTQIISTDNPALVIIAIDQSGSMMGPFTNHSMIVSKSEIATMIASAIINEMIFRSRHHGVLHRYFDFSVLGYSRQDIYPLVNSTLHPAPITVLDGITPTIKRRTIERLTPDNHLFLALESYSEWFVPQAAGITPMVDMFDTVAEIASEWCNNQQNKDSFPPIIINITDGLDSTEYNKHLLQKSEAIKQIGTSDGKSLIFNIYIDSTPLSERHNFPNIDTIAAECNILPLATISSTLPELFHPLAREYNPTVAPDYRALCYNAVGLNIIPSLNFCCKLFKNR